MTEDISIPVDAIEGIGPATAAKLAAAGVHTVFDLLRALASSIYLTVQSLASLQQVQVWTAMAELLLVEGMTAQWAEATVKSGIGSLSELSMQTPDKLMRLFATAQNAGVIPGVPDPVNVFGFILDAATLSYTGILLGAVKINFQVQQGNAIPFGDGAEYEQSFGGQRGINHAG